VFKGQLRLPFVILAVSRASGEAGVLACLDQDLITSNIPSFYHIGICFGAGF